MKWRKDYPGIDIFRMIAAILVIGIHTWPFADFGEIPELLFTRTIARIAVPFFFMASGFFLFGKGDEKGRSGFLKKNKYTLWSFHSFIFASKYLFRIF